MLKRLDARIGIVAAGYIAALLLATVAVWIQPAGDPTDGAASSGMQAFGDSLLFLMVLGLASLVPTGLAFYFRHESKAGMKERLK